MRLLAFALLLLPMAALAQQPEQQHQHSMRGESMPGKPMPMDHTQMMNHMQMMHGGSINETDARKDTRAPTEPGQSAFAAIQEIVQILEDDPQTDWSKVNIEALRQHLIDMNNVTLAAHVSNEAIDGGMKFVVTGDGAVRDSIQRMTSAHAATMDGVGGWHFVAKDTDEGSIFEVRVPPQDMDKLKALGFIGTMTRGMHHQQHHLMVAKGEHPHG
ncbi:hypothetical protein [Bradyrhizobium guangzhouense]|nr:hypothetical protein [Bradyrhizobium guangzhouense]